MYIRYDNQHLIFEGFENGRWQPIVGGVSKEYSNNLDALNKIDRYRVEVSLVCNLKCRYCVVHMNHVAQQNTMMSLNTAKKIVERFNKEVGTQGSIFIMGGEPLTNFEVVKYIIENVKSQSIIFTNALTLNDERIEFFYNNNTYILTSLDGYNLEQNEKRFWPNVEENFNIVVNNIRNAIHRGCKVGVSCLLHKGNVSDAEMIAHYFFNSLNAKSMSFAYPHLTLDDSEENNFDFEEYTNQMKKLYLFSKENGIYIDQIGKIISAIVYGSPTILGCKSGSSQRTFYPDGKETICTKIDTLHGFDMNTYIQNLPFFDAQCRECVGYGLCSGECPWDYHVSQQKGNKHDRICMYKKELIGFILEDIQNELKKASNCMDAKMIFNKLFIPMTNNYSES